MLFCCVVRLIRIAKNPKGRKKTATMVIISAHLTMTYRDNPRLNVFKRFLGCFPPFCSSLWQRTRSGNFTWCRCGSPAGRSDEVWLSRARLFSKCKQRHSRALSRICLCLRICLGVCFFFFCSHTQPPKYSQTRTLTHKFISFSIPSSQFTLHLSCLIAAEDCGTQRW